MTHGRTGTIHGMTVTGVIEVPGTIIHGIPLPGFIGTTRGITTTGALTTAITAIMVRAITTVITAPATTAILTTIITITDMVMP